MDKENLYVNNLSRAEDYVEQLHKKRDSCVIGVDCEKMSGGLTKLLNKKQNRKKVNERIVK